jgi:hypothetical protein
MGTAVPNKEARTRHTYGKTNSRDKRGFVDVLLNDITEERRGHTKEEDSKTECPFGRALGVTDIIGNFLTEHRPAVNSTDATMKQQRGNSGTNPLVRTPTA